MYLCDCSILIGPCKYVSTICMMFDVCMYVYMFECMYVCMYLCMFVGNL